MPTYVYKCTKCEKTEEHIHSIKEDPTIKCSSCQSEMKRTICHNFGGFVMKGGTEASHWKNKRQHLKKNELLEKRQKQSYGTGPKIRPNVAGMEVDSWSDAKKVAKEAGMNHESYTPWVEKENKEKKPKLVI